MKNFKVLLVSEVTIWIFLFKHIQWYNNKNNLQESHLLKKEILTSLQGNYYHSFQQLAILYEALAHFLHSHTNQECRDLFQAPFAVDIQELWHHAIFWHH